MWQADKFVNENDEICALAIPNQISVISTSVVEISNSITCATGNAWRRVRVGEGYSIEFERKIGVHQGWVLSRLLFVIVLEAFSCQFRSGVPWEDLYADDHVIIAESLQECVRRLLTWKEAMEKKGLRVNAGKKIMICGITGRNVWAWTSCRVQASFHAPSIALEWATPASTGCIRTVVCSIA